MKLTDTKVAQLNIVNNLQGETDLQLAININYTIALAEDGSPSGLGTVFLKLEDTNDENDFPFSIDVTYQGIFEYIMGEEIERQSLNRIYDELTKFVAKLTVDLGLSRIQLPDIKNLNMTPTNKETSN